MIYIVGQIDKYFENENIRQVGANRLKNGEKIHLENAVLLWFCEVRRYNVTLSDQILIEKAKEIAEMIEVEYFAGWLQKFKARNNILLKPNHRESGGAKESLEQDDRAQIKNITSKFMAEDI